MYPDFSKYTSLIEEITFNDNDDDNKYTTINLKTSFYKIVIDALGDCCSYSWFEKYEDYDYNFLQGKIIKKIKEIELPDTYVYPFEEDYECISTHLYEITFKNDKNSFKLLLINSSNGYYDGYIGVNILL